MVTNMKVDLREVQEQMGDNAKVVRQMGRKATLATLGLFGMAYDTSKCLWSDGMHFASRAEKRGEEVEKEFRTQFEKFQNMSQEEIDQRIDQWKQRIGSFSDGLTAYGKDAEKEVRSFLAFMQKLGREGASPEVDSITIEVDVELHEPFAGYDEMNVQEVTARLQGMNADELTEVRVYELATKNRITILREIEELL